MASKLPCQGHGEETEKQGTSLHFSIRSACVRRGERAKANTTGRKVNRRNREPAAAGQNRRRNPRCRQRGEGAGKGEPEGSRRRREGSQALPRNRGGRVKLILTQFRNCAAPAGRPAEPAGALGTCRRPELGGRPAPVLAAPPGAPASAALGGPRAPHWREALAPGAPSPRTSRPALGECGRPRWGCRGVLARGQGPRRPQEPPPAPPPLPRAVQRGSARSAAAGAAPDGGVGDRLAPAADASGLGAGLGGRAGLGRPGGSAPSPGRGQSAREERRGGAPLGRALGLQPRLPGFPARASPVRRRPERHCNGTGTPALHCGSF